jgi:hypothetical protein
MSIDLKFQKNITYIYEYDDVHQVTIFKKLHFKDLNHFGF